MDFSEIGIKSRKTGLKAKENVKRDEHDMEDLDDFFREEQTTLVQESNTTTLPNGRIIFPPSIDDKDLRSPTSSNRLRNSPLLSPLPAHSQRKDTFSRGLSINKGDDEDDDDASDQFDDANEDPPTNNNNDEEQDMEIDDESRGDIKMINNDNNNNDDISFDYSFNEDNEKVYPNRSPTKSSGRDSHTPKIRPNPLFVPQSDDESSESIPNSTAKSFFQRQQELERNTTVRSPAKKQLQQPLFSRQTAPSSKNPSPTAFNATTLLKSPREVIRVQPSSKSIASLSKNLALNKKKLSSSLRKPRTPSPNSGSDDESDYNDSGKDVESDDDDNSPTQQSIGDDASPDVTSDSEGNSMSFGEDDSGSEEVTLRSKKFGKKVEVSDDDDLISNLESDDDNRRGRSRSRVNKFKRNEPPSPSKEHVIDVKRLRKEQQSRSASRGVPEEQPTRRSSRVRIPPLAFWRNERAIYEKGKGDKVPTLKKIITVDDNIEPLKSRAASRASSRRPLAAKKSSNNNSRASSKPRITKKPPRIYEQIDEEDEEQNEQDVDDEEEAAVSNGEYRGSEWLKNGFLKLDTFEGHGSDVKTDRLIAWAPGTESFSSSVVSATDNFKLAILFDKNRDFIATGMMLIPPGGVKSLKSTDSTYFVFYCISGIVEVTLSGSVFLIKKGCSLEIPMGNFYQFVNKGKKDATLFFVQTRGNINEEEEWDE